jgi:hypothetical protein
MRIKGLVDSLCLVVGTSWVDLGRNWASLSVYNDGDADLYLRNDDLADPPWVDGKAPIKKGESIHLNGEAKENGYCPSPRFICQSGTASIRIFRLL